MIRWLMLLAILLAAGCGACNRAVATTATRQESVLAILKDFEGELEAPRPIVMQHSWTAEQKANAIAFGTREVVAGGYESGQSCKLVITDQMPWGTRDSYRVFSLRANYLPPTADAVRMRVKVLKGKMALSVGSPTVYFGHSDVMAAPQMVEAGTDPQWQTLEFSLHHDLLRNFRRARFGRNSPVIYYTRWVQEPMYVIAMNGSQGEVLIDQIELIAKGEGRPYPAFSESDIQTVRTIADFEDPAEMDKTFTFFQEPVDFSAGPKLTRPSWPPPKMERVEQGQRGRFSLLAEQKGAEEVCFAGVKVAGVEGANAIRLTVKAEHPGPFDDLVIDFIVYVTPGGEAFPWQQFEPPAEWKKESAIAFNYYLSREATQGTTYGFYHIRRIVPKGQWTTLVLPLADFICAAGQGRCEPMFKQQLPLRSEDVIALGFLPPLRQAGAATKIYIDEMAFVKVPGTDAELRSFWQKTDVTRIKLTPLDNPYGGMREQSAK